MIHVCVPVLKRYDLLHAMLASLKRSAVLPDAVFVIDNGGDTERLLAAVDDDVFPVHVHRPKRPLGVAESWNWFVQNVSEERVIVNDDVTFEPESLGKLIAPDADLVWAFGCGFSCFVLRDSCVQKIGLFDETISPGYGYYEDEDYLQRLDGRGTRPPSACAVDVECGVAHLKSQTLAANSSEEMLEHHRKFWVAQSNYIAKWHLERVFR